MTDTTYSKGTGPAVEDTKWKSKEWKTWNAYPSTDADSTDFCPVFGIGICAREGPTLDEPKDPAEYTSPINSTKLTDSAESNFESDAND